MAKRIKNVLDIGNPIVAAVLPLKQEAIARAEKDSKAYVVRVMDKMREHGDDINAAYPWPKSNESDYRYRCAIRHEIEMMVECKDDVHNSMRPGEPRIVQFNSERVKKYIEDAKRNAADQYDSFVLKLTEKIGVVETASLSGSHVWGYTILTVTKSVEVHGRKFKVRENWKTEQIVNRSVYGLLFNQWPSRKMK